MSTNAGDGI